jgi:hypothetical protein
MQPYSNPTGRNMEDNLNIFENGRRPQYLLKEDNLNFLKMEDNLLKNDATKKQLKQKH